MSDPCGEMIALLLQCERNIEAVSVKRNARAHELDLEYQKICKTDEVLNRHVTELEEWRKTLRQVKEEMFPPGTLIELAEGNIRYTKAGVPVRYVVVEEVDRYNTSVRVHHVTSPPSKRVHSVSIPIGPHIRIIVPQMITDRQLRKNAEALILKVRLKDWHQ